jgi:hypothetical protein
MARIPSHSAAWKASAASSTAASVGLGGLRSNQLTSVEPITSAAMPAARTPGSVTTNGRVIARSASTSPSSADAPKPNEAVVR